MDMNSFILIILSFFLYGFGFNYKLFPKKKVLFNGTYYSYDASRLPSSCKEPLSNICLASSHKTCFNVVNRLNHGSYVPIGGLFS